MGDPVRVLLLVGIFLASLAPPVAPASVASCSGPANDCAAGAIEWFGKPGTFSNVGAATEAGEPRACDGETVHASVWFLVEVVAPGSSDALGVSLEAPFYATLGLYTRSSGGAFTLVSCQASWYDEGLHSPTAFAPCTPGSVYWIQVGGIDASSQGHFELSEFSSFWRDECWFEPTLPTEPRVGTPSGGAGEIVLSWVEPWWDGGRSVSLSHYRVYRSDSCTGSFTHVASPSQRSYRDTGLPPGATRCYKVTAVNPVGEGPSEPGRSATTWTVPSAPPSLSVAPGGDGQLVLSWTPSPDAGGPAPMVRHDVYRSASVGGPFSLVGSAGATATAFTDAGLGRGTTHHYRVTAVNAVGESPASPVASGTTYKVPGAPTGVSVRHRLSLQPHSFEVSWSAPVDPSPFTHYRVYRATDAGVTPTLIATVPATTSVYVDPFRASALDYHYEIRASNPAGDGPASSRVCYSYPPLIAYDPCD